MNDQDILFSVISTESFSRGYIYKHNIFVNFRIISNRVSAEKAKERKKQYLIELEKTYKKLQVDVAVLPKSVQLEKV